MLILLKSSDSRALDFAVKQILAEGSSAAIPLPSLIDRLPNGEIVSHVSRRLVKVFEVTDETITKFQKMTLPSTVEIQIS